MDDGRIVAGTIDLWTGEIRSNSPLCPNGRLSPWKRREKAVATEIFLATECGAGCLHLFQIALWWPPWLECATSLQAMRTYLSPLRWTLNKALNNFGWMAATVDKRGTSLTPYAGKEVTAWYAITAEAAVVPLRLAIQAAADKDYATAVVNATTALELCHESFYARLIIGTGAFLHGQVVGEETALDTAMFLVDYQKRLRHGADVLTCLLRQEQESRNGKIYRWEDARGFVEAWERQLVEYNELFERARDFLNGG